jgi:hypothetical protein
MLWPGEMDRLGLAVMVIEGNGATVTVITVWLLQTPGAEAVTV